MSALALKAQGIPSFFLPGSPFAIRQERGLSPTTSSPRQRFASDAPIFGVEEDALLGKKKAQQQGSSILELLESLQAQWGQQLSLASSIGFATTRAAREAAKRPSLETTPQVVEAEVKDPQQSRLRKIGAWVYKNRHELSAAFVGAAAAFPARWGLRAAGLFGVAAAATTLPVAAAAAAFVASVAVFATAGVVGGAISSVVSQYVGAKLKGEEFTGINKDKLKLAMTMGAIGGAFGGTVADLLGKESVILNFVEAFTTAAPKTAVATLGTLGVVAASTSASVARFVFGPLFGWERKHETLGQAAKSGATLGLDLNNLGNSLKEKLKNPDRKTLAFLGLVGLLGGGLFWADVAAAAAADVPGAGVTNVSNALGSPTPPVLQGGIGPVVGNTGITLSAAELGTAKAAAGLGYANMASGARALLTGVQTTDSLKRMLPEELGARLLGAPSELDDAKVIKLAQDIAKELGEKGAQPGADPTLGDYAKGLALQVKAAEIAEANQVAASKVEVPSAGAPQAPAGSPPSPSHQVEIAVVDPAPALPKAPELSAEAAPKGAEPPKVEVPPVQSGVAQQIAAAYEHKRGITAELAKLLDNPAVPKELKADIAKGAFSLQGHELAKLAEKVAGGIDKAVGAKTDIDLLNSAEILRQKGGCFTKSLQGLEKAGVKIGAGQQLKLPAGVELDAVAKAADARNASLAEAYKAKDDVLDSMKALAAKDPEYLAALKKVNPALATSIQEGKYIARGDLGRAVKATEGYFAELGKVPANKGLDAQAWVPTKAYQESLANYDKADSALRNEVQKAGKGMKAPDPNAKDYLWRTHGGGMQVISAAGNLAHADPGFGTFLAQDAKASAIWNAINEKKAPTPEQLKALNGLMTKYLNNHVAPAGSADERSVLRGVIKDYTTEQAKAPTGTGAGHHHGHRAAAGDTAEYKGRVLTNYSPEYLGTTQEADRLYRALVSVRSGPAFDQLSPEGKELLTRAFEYDAKDNGARLLNPATLSEKLAKPIMMDKGLDYDYDSLKRNNGHIIGTKEEMKIRNDLAELARASASLEDAMNRVSEQAAGKVGKAATSETVFGMREDITGVGNVAPPRPAPHLGVPLPFNPKPV